MKQFAIGDGHKLINCPDRYLGDFESDDAFVIWDPDNPDTVVRATVFTVEPKDTSDFDAGYWCTIKSANEKGIKPQVVAESALFWERIVSEEEGSVFHFCEVGMKNHKILFSLAAPIADEKTPEFERARNDLVGMIESLTIRSDDESFTASLLEFDKEMIDSSLGEVLGETQIESAIPILEERFVEAKQSSDLELATKIGIVFGEVIRNQIPSFQWARTIDELGADRSLVLEGTSITLFPESSIIKRVESQDEVTIAELMNGILDAVEDMYRDHHSEP